MRERLTRFALIGVLNTGIDLLLFSLLQPTLGIFAANIVSTSCGMIFSFVVNGRFTFRDGAGGRRSAVLFFATTSATLWLVQPAIIAVVVSIADGPTTWDDHTRAVAGKIVAIPCAVALNFISYHFIVWPRKRPDHG